MEYEFRRNSLDGSVQAIFSMDHEVIGRWLSDELSQDIQLVADLLEKIKLIHKSELNQYKMVGADFTLEMTLEQVWVYANVLGYEEEYELEEDLSLYDAESNAFCGLDDFEHVLSSWQIFLNEMQPKTGIPKSAIV